MATAQNGRMASAEQTTHAEPASLLDRVVEATRYSVRDVETMAQKAARSQMYGMDESQAFTLMMIAESEGLHPIQALKRYHIIFKRPSMRADAMQAEFQRHGGRLRWVETTDEVCEVEAWHPMLNPEHLTFRTTLKELIDRKIAQEWDKDKGQWYIKDMYRKYPRQMLRARVISEMVRAIDPGIVVGTYTPEEISDFSSAPAPAEERGPVAIIERPDQPTTLVHEPNNEPKAVMISPAKAWVRNAIQMANDKLRNLMLIEGKGDEFKPVVSHVNQVVNAMITAWVEDGTLDRATVDKPNGTRDPAKAGAAFQVGWQQDEGEVKEDVWAILMRKAREHAKAAGIELRDEDLVELPEALAGAADDAFEEGRE